MAKKIEMDHLDRLESESIYIIREAYSKYDKLGMLWSAGKDSTTLAHLVRKAFLGKVPIPAIYIDTGFHFQEMYDFRDKLVEDWDLNLIIAKNEEADKKGITHEDKLKCCGMRKTQALKDVIAEYGFDALLLGIRRDEHGIRAKERTFSPRDQDFRWQYKDQPPELWDQYKSQQEAGQHLRVHPLLSWTELDVWRYIKREDLPVNKLYFAEGGKRYRCFSEDTRVLTSDGLKAIDEVSKESEIATLNKSGGLEFYKPQAIYRYGYDGPLFHVKNASIDLLITPNHRIYYRRRYRHRSRKSEERAKKVKRDKKRYKAARELRAQGLTHQEISQRLDVSRSTITRWLNGTVKPRYMSTPTEDPFRLDEVGIVFSELKPESIEFKRDCRWSGEIEERFRIPDEFFKKRKDGSPIKCKTGKYEFELNQFLRFLGWYLSEGCSTRRRIEVCQSKGENYEEICEDIKKLGLHPQRQDDRIVIGNAPLARYLKSLGTAKEKHIPRWIKNLDKESLSKLLETLMKGDGSFNEDGSYRRYTTASWKLANDVLEIGLKLGYPVNISKDRGTWLVWFSGKRFSTPRLSKEPELVQYKGRVWDVEVENHVLMCERKGKLCWTGNSLGCKPCTEPVESNVKNVDDMIKEIKESEVTERSGRAQDKEEAHAMQKLRALGYM